MYSANALSKIADKLEEGLHEVMKTNKKSHQIKTSKNLHDVRKTNKKIHWGLGKGAL